MLYDKQSLTKSRGQYCIYVQKQMTYQHWTLLIQGLLQAHSALCFIFYVFYGLSVLSIFSPNSNFILCLSDWRYIQGCDLLWEHCSHQQKGTGVKNGMIWEVVLMVTVYRVKYGVRTKCLNLNARGLNHLVEQNVIFYHQTKLRP